jgi:hypothetical protein
LADDARATRLPSARRRWKRCHAREREHAREVLAPKEIVSVRLQRRAEVLDLVGGQEAGQELVGALADLRAQGLERNMFAKGLEAATPGLRVQVDGVDQGPIDVEDDGVGHDVGGSKRLAN